MRKWALLAAVLVLLTAGCAKSGRGLDPAHPVTVMIWHYYNGAQKNAFDALVDEFNETVGLEKGIVVESHNQGSVEELEASVNASLNKEVGSQQLPNIFQTYADTAFAANEKGFLADLDAYFKPESQEKYVDAYIEEGRIGADGSLKIFPVAKSTEVMMLNKTDWDKFAATTGADMADLATKEGVVRVAEAYYNWTDSLTPDIPDDGKAFYGRDAMANLFIIGSKQLGCELFHVDKGEVTLNIDRDVMRRIWDIYYVPSINGWFGSYGRFRSDDAKVGKLIALTGSTSSAAYFPAEVTTDTGEVYSIEAAVLPAPQFEDGERVAVQQGAGMAVVSSTPAEEYASVMFLQWFTEAERNLRFSYESGYMPVLKEANDFELVMRVAEEPMSKTKEMTLRAAFDTVNSNELYTNKAFQNGGQARNVLDDSLKNRISDDLAAIEAKMASGMSRADAAALYNTDENFSAWFEEFCADLTEAVRG